MDIIEHRAEVAAIETFWRQAGDAPILYVHGNPNNSDLWVPFLERTGGVAMDLPGFGRSAKPADFRYSIEGYGDWLDAFMSHLGWDRCRALVHDWGVVGLTLGARIEKLVIVDAVPFFSGYKWHRFARIWRTPVLGELLQGSTTKWALRRLLPDMPEDFIGSIWDHYDHGTQRAVLKLYRSAPPDVLARAGEMLKDVNAPALVIWGSDDRYLPTRFAHAYGEALKAEVEVVDGAGHWPWIDKPELVERVCAFLS